MIKYVHFVLKAIPTLVTKYHKVKKMEKHPEKYSLEERFNTAQDFLRRINKAAFHCEFIIQGEENILNEQAIYYANHTSNGDPITFLNIMPRPFAFLAKQEAMKMVIVGTLAKLVGSQFIDREDLRSELKVFKAIDKELTDNPSLSFVVFPEGTRSKRPDFKLGDFHPGSFKIATRREAPIVPVALFMTDRLLFQKYHYKKYPIQVRFLKPLYKEDYADMSTKEIADYCKTAIENALIEMRKLDPEYVAELNGYSQKKLEKVLYLS